MQKRKDRRAEKAKSRETRQEPRTPEQPKGFSFTDRSGKVHTVSRGDRQASPAPVRPAGFQRPDPVRLPDHPTLRPAPSAQRSRSIELETEATVRGVESGGLEAQDLHSYRAAPHRAQRHKPERRGPPAPSEARHKPGGKKKARPSGPARTLKATVDKNRKGFGFLIFADRSVEDLFLPPRDAQNLFHGDRVEVTLTHEGQVAQLTVVEHRFRELVGRFQPRGTRGGVVIYERRKAREEVYIPKPDPGAKPNDWVRARVKFDDEQGGGVTGEITQVYGPELPAQADIGMVAAEYNLVEEHTAEAEQEARSFTLDLDLKKGRQDLRNIPFITIDGETARDFDDAIYVERNKSGFILWVAIADVSHYVTPGSALDSSARGRGTSVYFPEKAFHMLPRALSENLCSLRPHEPRLAMVARMEFDHKGEPTGTRLMDALIESRRRATYNEIQAEWEANQSNKGWVYEAHFALYQLIRQRRNRRGSIDFDLPEAEIRVDEAGEVQWIRLRERQDAHRLIEEFMIAANEAVTTWIQERDWPFLYRIHEEPSEEALRKFQKLAATVGVKVQLDRPGRSLSQALNEVVLKLGNHPASVLLNMALLRSMRQAVYSASHDIHFGLASEGYTHFTSPIRRYPDLVVHRMLRMALQADNGISPRPPHGELEKTEQELHEVAEHCSYRERVASEAERESIRLKQIRAMLSRVGDEFEGKIVGMVESGFFVQLADPYVEGMVTQESLNDDFYQFNEERMIFYGTRKRRTFRIGQPVRVTVLRANIDERKIELGLVDEHPDRHRKDEADSAGAPDQDPAEAAERERQERRAAAKERRKQARQAARRKPGGGGKPGGKGKAGKRPAKRR